MSELPTRIANKFIPDLAGCWVWIASKNPQGYGWTTFKNRSYLAHRAVYELLVGPIPDGLQCDHLCLNKSCVNPAHIEIVTAKVNTLRGTNPCAISAKKTHCIHGHEFTPANTYRGVANRRDCLTCKRLRNQRIEAERTRKRRQAAIAAGGGKP